MKKIVVFVLVVVFCLSLSACGKSEAVKNVETTIDALGEITIESHDAICFAEEVYNSLSAEEQTKVENYKTLTEARDSYYELVLVGDWCVYYINQTNLYDIPNLYNRINLSLNPDMSATDFGDGGEPITGSWNIENRILTVGEVGKNWTAYEIIDENGEIFLNMEGSNWSLMRVEEFKAYLDQIPNISEDDARKLAEAMPDGMSHPKDVVEFIMNQTYTESELSDTNINAEVAQDPLALNTTAWVCDEWVAEDGSVMTIHDDHTCEIAGESFTWEFESMREGMNCDIDVFDGETLRFQLSFWTMDISENGVEGEESVVAVYPIEADGDRGDQTNYSCSSEWEIVEITADNWQDYIELVEASHFQTDDFGEKTVRLGKVFQYKDGIYVRSESSVSIELVAEPVERSIVINADEETYELGEVIPSHGDPFETIIKLSGNDYRTFGTVVELTIEETSVRLLSIKETLRVGGTIYVFIGE